MLPTLMLCVFGITTGEFVLAGILPGVAAGLDISIPAAGLLVTAYALGMIAGGPALTALTARYPRKPLIMVLLAVAVAGNVASAVAPTYAVLFATRVVTALVTATFFANAIVIVATAAPEDRKASAVARLALGMNLAMILGAPLGTFVGTHYGWRATFVAIAVCCAVGLALLPRFVPATAGAAGSATAELRVFRAPAVWLAIAVTAVGNAGALVVFTYFAPLATEVGGFADGTVPVLLLVYGVGAAVGNLLGGKLADRSPVRSQLWLLTALAAVLALMWLDTNVVLVFVLGAAGFAIVPGMQARVLTAAGDAPTLAIAVNASAYQVAAAFAGWLGGVALGLGTRSLFLVAAAITVVGIAVAAVRQVRPAVGTRG
ncbi:MFS transporter [Actinophytocola sp.]|uniref:MFS transporter n=1 Tax=Actinophytocola sp. TaxID=1872138 RepID=UPI002ED09DAC